MFLRLSITSGIRFVWKLLEICESRGKYILILIINCFKSLNLEGKYMYMYLHCDYFNFFHFTPILVNLFVRWCLQLLALLQN